MTLPNVYLIGAPKAGTTSLSRWMASHPDIYFSDLKEPVFWATDYPRLRELRGYDSLEAYERLFSSQEARQAKIRAEGSTVYLYSQTAVPQIIRAVPEARFIVALRNPAELVVSFHRTQRLLLNEDEPDFAAAWRRNREGRVSAQSPLDAKLVDYATVGRLGRAVSSLLEVVDREQVLFIKFDDLVRDPHAVWLTLTDFIGVAAEPTPDFAVHNASNRVVRFRRLQHLRVQPPAMFKGPIGWLGHVSRTSRNSTIRKVKRRIFWRPEAKPSVSAELRAELADFFAADVRLLGTLLGSDMSAWTEKYRLRAEQHSDSPEPR